MIPGERVGVLRADLERRATQLRNTADIWTYLTALTEELTRLRARVAQLECQQSFLEGLR